MALGVGPISSGAISSRPSSGGAVAYTLSGAHGTYSITGQSASFTVARNLSGANGTYAITGQAASFGVARQLSGANGTYTINGQPATMTYTPGGSPVAYELSGAYGTYSIVGIDAVLDYVPGSPEQTVTGGGGKRKYKRPKYYSDYRHPDEPKVPEIIHAVREESDDEILILVASRLLH